MLKYVTEEYELSKPRDGDVGYDLRAMEDVTIWPGIQHVIATGIRLEIPAGYGGLVKDRSSMASKQVYTHGGVIDESYRGEIKVLLANHGNMPHQVRKGDKIAQLLIVPVLTVETERVLVLPDTIRGEGGFGSTGV